MNTKQEWEKEFDERFTFMQSWTGGMGLSQGSSESPTLKQDIWGIKEFISKLQTDTIQGIRGEIESKLVDDKRFKTKYRQEWDKGYNHALKEILSTTSLQINDKENEN